MTLNTTIVLTLRYCVCVLLACNAGKIYAQQIDTLTFSALNKSKFASFLDDTYLIGGVSYSSIYYSNHFKSLSYQPGFIFGAEHYFPLRRKVFLTTGVNLVERRFAYRPAHSSTVVQNIYLDFPVAASFELPVLKKYDLRFITGANLGFRLHTAISTTLHQAIWKDTFRYSANQFNTVDLGWHFGLSAEYRNLVLRARSYSGFVKLDYKDQGMNNSFTFELGYFLFRSLNKK